MGETRLVTDVMALERKLALIRTMKFNYPELGNMRVDWLSEYKRLLERPDYAGSQFQDRVESLHKHFVEVCEEFDRLIDEAAREIA